MISIAEAFGADTLAPSVEKYVSKNSALEVAHTLIFEPYRYLVRVTEEMSLEGDSSVRRTSLELAVPEVPLLVPIAFPLKGALIDTITIEPSREVRASTLGMKQANFVAGLLLDRMLATVSLAPAGGEEQVSKLLARLMLARPGVALQGLSDLRNFVAQTAGGLTEEQDSLLLAANFFAQRLPLFVPCQPDGTILRIDYKVETPLRNMSSQRTTQNVRQSMGRFPNETRIEIPLANRTRSYHFRFKAPDAHWVREVECLAIAGTNRAQGVKVSAWEVTPYKPADPSADCGLKPDSTGYCHVHLERVGKDPKAQFGLLLNIRIAEVPLGEMGVALVRLLAVLIGCLVMMIFGKNFVTATSTALISVLIALPALLGVSIFAVDRGHVHGSLLARWLSLLAVASSLGLAAVIAAWVVEATRLKSSDPNLVVYEASGGVLVMLWTILLVVAAGAIVCTTDLISNFVRFDRARLAHFRRRRDAGFHV